MIMKQHATDESNDSQASAHEDTLCDWTCCIISGMSNVVRTSLFLSYKELIDIFLDIFRQQAHESKRKNMLTL